MIRQRRFLHINCPGNGCFQHLIRWLSVWFRIWVGRIWVILLLSAFPSGVATADFSSPVVPIFCILLGHFNLSHVVFHNTPISLRFGLPGFLFPGKFILSILLPIYPSYFLCICPYHVGLASYIFSPNHPPYDVPLLYSFLILSILVTSNETRNIFNSC